MDQQFDENNIDQFLNDLEVRDSEFDTPKPFEFVSNPEWVQGYKLFQEKFNPKSDVVYYPCSGSDSSPSLGFPSSRVIYVDMFSDEEVKRQREAGFECHGASALEFNPGDVDILIMQNPTISPDVPSSYVVKDGFILCNNYHSTATLLHQNPQYKFEGVIRKGQEGLIFDTDKLDDVFPPKDSHMDDIFVFKKL